MQLKTIKSTYCGFSQFGYTFKYVVSFDAFIVTNSDKKFTTQRESVVHLVNASFLPKDLKDRYIAIWDQKISDFN